METESEKYSSNLKRRQTKQLLVHTNVHSFRPRLFWYGGQACGCVEGFKPIGGGGGGGSGL